MAASRPRILVSESRDFSSKALAKLQQLGDVVLGDLSRHDLLSAATETDVLWVRLRHIIDTEVMAAAPRLKVIATPTTGLNHIDLDEAQRRTIAVLSLRGEVEILRQVRATAEHTIALILALLRRVPSAAVHVQDGGWDRDLFKGSELFGKTVGILGYGRLGRIVANYLKAFETRVLATSLESQVVESGITHVSFSELLQESNLISVHVNLTDRTTRFLGKREFSRMKKGTWFINTSRGEVVDEDALLAALHSGHLAGAALDVLCDERSEGMGTHPLVVYARQHDNLLITPHTGGCTAESMEKTENFMAEKLCRWWAAF